MLTLHPLDVVKTRLQGDLIIFQQASPAMLLVLLASTSVHASNLDNQGDS